MKKPAVSTIIGFGIGIFCIISSIKMSGNFSSFLNWPSVFITVGGTTGAVVVSFPPRKLRTLGHVMKKAFKKEQYDFVKDIQTIVSLSEIARSKGLLALEDSASKYADDEFLQKGILLIADGVGEDVLKKALRSEIYFAKKRHQDGHAMLDMIANTSTSLGLLGTYIGLIPMLENLEDPTKLGPLMAIELVTSFYGAFIAYVVFMPMSKRLKVMSTDEALRKEFLLEGLTSIMEGKNPRTIQENMISCLTKKDVKKMGSVSKQIRELKMKGVA
ncbi:motility protein A [Caproiciproducens sp. R1]|uniref:MotA/TolQ/ExbB proton channel family protein n=1 Tax=Caproiciproducens sp. R1 TaxID=3435000 RepID=UPI0005A5F339